MRGIRKISRLFALPQKLLDIFQKFFFKVFTAEIKATLVSYLLSVSLFFSSENKMAGGKFLAVWRVGQLSLPLELKVLL